MKRISATVLSATLAFGVSAVAPSSTGAAAKSFKNCTELNKSYKGGIVCER
ncbi:hypothetical protein RG959_21425 [Domibacillus sp. 8LH]|uniref:hypothetical protein n=1 Tax=Domibacillus sp. 8LH TaxID=3073900 RepID=UPI0031727C9B